MAVYSVIRGGMLVCAALALLPVWAQQSSTQIVSKPTRMQRCQAEIGDVKGSARTVQLRKCLIDRTEGERLLTRDCGRQYRALPKGHKADKVAFQKQCVANGLNAGHQTLPRRKVPAPEVQASGAAASQPTASKAQATFAAAAVATAAPPAASKAVDKPTAKAPTPAAKPAPSAAAPVASKE